MRWWNANASSRKARLCISSIVFFGLVAAALFSGALQELQHHLHKISAFVSMSQQDSDAKKQDVESTYYNANTSVRDYAELTDRPSSRRPVTERSDPPDQFVSFDECINDGRRLGNQIFGLAAVIYVAELAGRKPVLAQASNISLERVFNLSMERVEALCPCRVIGESRQLAYDTDIENIVFNEAERMAKTILVEGFRQSWKYTLSIERQLRKQLVLRDEIRRFAEDFLQSAVPSGWKKVGFVRVGIHSRRGDNVKEFFVNYGYTVPSETYFYKAMKYFTDRYSRVQFVVSSDDCAWAREHIADAIGLSSDAVSVTSTGSNNTAGQDFAVLSMCDHVIMSTGTYGWWAAWIAKGTTIYYADWPRKGSNLERQFTKEDFFPPNWIPMSDYNSSVLTNCLASLVLFNLIFHTLSQYGFQ